MLSGVAPRVNSYSYLHRRRKGGKKERRRRVDVTIVCYARHTQQARTPPVFRRCGTLAAGWPDDRIRDHVLPSRRHRGRAAPTGRPNLTRPGVCTRTRRFFSPGSRLCRLRSYPRTHVRIRDEVERMDEAVTTPPTFKRSFFERIYCVEFSPYEWSQHLICIALAKEIVVGTVRFQDEDDAVEDMAYNPIRTFNHDARPHAITWSPETSLSIVPKILTFCVAGSDFKIRLYNSNLNDINVYEILEGHKDYVNAISYEPEGELLASVSDDHTSKLWAVKENQKCVSTFYLTSPGISVCWHNEESGKLLVAEKNGLIRMYNVRSQQAIMSLDSGAVPLTAADWGPNPLKVISMAAGELLLWDLSRPSRPLDERTLHVEGGLTAKVSHANENLVSSIGWPDNLLKVVNLRSKVVVLCGKVKLIGGMTWHYKLPYVCAGSDRELCFWRININ